MGNCLCLLVPDDDDECQPVTQPSNEERRRQLAEAAEKRAAGDRSRGVKDPGSVKRMEERRDELERRQAENVGTSDQPTLRWTQG
ncbi:hypothetical protein ACHWQZ_G012429 [Mnemiopsis leidyi]